MSWYIPSKPKIMSVEWGKLVQGTNVYYFVTKDQAVKLVDNVDEMKAYIEKMHLLIRVMSEHYGAQLEEYKKLEK